ncbi:kinase-like domain-containing protein [Halteromyces radiatus]|uniref:kinase-like domain-containing protein n=1 Tax=Halteromyces radiatus TaxID=101107 RepID=UPI00221E56F2|nr:kinase-like domain-containing protein [Halteromyces radiatus]KAI8097235.1 kinase-like domain-containing protein [Halteromyces radiatus]
MTKSSNKMSDDSTKTRMDEDLVSYITSTCSVSSSEHEKTRYNESSSFLQRCMRHGYKSSTSLLESRYGRLQKGKIGRGAYAHVRLIIANHHHHYRHHKHHSLTNNNKIKTTISKQVYAVKIFKKQKQKESHGNYMKRLISEYCIASSMHHPNIITTLDLVTNASGQYCIVMEYCSGGDLYQAIKKDQLTESKMNSYFKQLLLGLDYLHSLGVAHRDIKPENLLLDDDGRTLKITDFGVADVFCETWQKHSRLSDGFCGSLAFIAPEVFSILQRRNYSFHNHGYQATKVDVWSAAIVYCCMWLKGTLFNSAEKSDPHYRTFLKAYYSRSFTPLAALSEHARSFIYLMLDPEPDQRISIPQVLSIPFIMDIDCSL